MVAGLAWPAAPMSYLFSLNCRVYDVYVRCIASNTFPLTLRNTKHIFATFLLQAITHRDKFRKRLRCANLTQLLSGIMLWTWWKSDIIENMQIHKSCTEIWKTKIISKYLPTFLEATYHIGQQKLHMWHVWRRCVVPVRKQSHDNALQLFALASYVIHPIHPCLKPHFITDNKYCTFDMFDVVLWSRWESSHMTMHCNCFHLHHM